MLGSYHWYESRRTHTPMHINAYLGHKELYMYLDMECVLIIILREYFCVSAERRCSQ